MREAVDQMVEEPYLWWWLRQYDGTSQVAFDDDSMQLVESVRLRAAFEHGGKRNHGLHVHIVIEVAHRTMVQIDKRGLCDIFRKFVGMNPNCDVRFIKGVGEDKDFILHYITKEVPSYKPESALNARLKSAFASKNEQQDAENTYL